MDAGTRTFTIDACLGRGGFGEVYRARMTRDGGLATDVALKVLRRDIDPDGQAVQRLRDEGRLLARLNHPAILKVHDLLVLDGRIALVTEYVDGADLSACLGPDGRIPARALLQVIARVASALNAAWTSVPEGEGAPLRMVHRDIKPSNIRLSRHGDVKLLDFGIARTDAVDREARTRTDMMVGSPAYMAPERFLEREIRLESDVFSLGVVLYEGLCGERFWSDLPVPMQVGLAFDGGRFATFAEERLGRVQARPDVLDLLRHTLSFAPAERPSPAELGSSADALADSAGGPTLARWCRSRTWVSGKPTVGELDGRSLTEGTLALPSAPRGVPVVHDSPLVTGTLERPAPTDRAPPDEPEDGGRMGWALVGLGGTGVIGVVAAGAAVLLGVVGLALAWPALTSGPVTDPPAVVPRSEPVVPPPEPVAPPPEPVAPPPEPVPRPAEPVAPAPEPARVSLVPAPSAPVSPRPAESAPTPAPEPAPVASEPVPTGPPPGRIEVEGDVVALVQVDGREIVLPADVPPGSWPMKARFNGRDAVDAGQVTVASGQTVRFSCSTRMMRCTRR